MVSQREREVEETARWISEKISEISVRARWFYGGQLSRESCSSALRPEISWTGQVNLGRVHKVAMKNR